MKPPLSILPLGLLLIFLWSPASAQTYTAPGSQTFTNPTAWDFGAGSFGTWDIPVSDAALTLNILTHGTPAQTATNDLNLTLNTLNLDTFNTGTTTLAASLGGDYAFTGAAQINLLGTGSAVFSAPIVLGSGATGLTFDGAGTAFLFNISGVIASNTSVGAALHIATDARNVLTSNVILGGANTFAGGVVLDSGALALSNARALGDRSNVLTINGGVLRASSTITTQPIRHRPINR